ncbi:hypothetical protein M9H77_36396 [Catharanthus roseus]|uniref:Uncharacterized protein n=1 Tax=Catharanthus roseus TaxID=4058 RepID=A0ACB9ZRN1_CATRO|nr:hypothetical protein M9H77_36396 [Catharanthus roseus]
MANVSSLPYVEGFSTNRPPLFNGTNYTFWKSRIKIYICSINFDLWSIVEKGPYILKKDGIVKKKGFNNRGKKPPFKKGGQSSSLFKARCFEYNSTDLLVAECPKAIEKEKGALEARLEKEKDCSNNEFQKLVLENKNVCEKISSLEKCLVDYEVLKKKVNDLTLCIERFTQGKENFEKLLGSQRYPYDTNALPQTLSGNLFKMVKTQNANIGRGANIEEEGNKKGKGKRVPSGARAPERFISVKEAAKFEKCTRNRRKIAPGHVVDLNDMQGMETIPNLFDAIGWTSLLTVNELFYPEMIYEFYANLHKGRVENVENISHQLVLSRIRGTLHLMIGY